MIPTKNSPWDSPAVRNLITKPPLKNNKENTIKNLPKGRTPVYISFCVLSIYITILYNANPVPTKRDNNDMIL